MSFDIRIVFVHLGFISSLLSIIDRSKFALTYTFSQHSSLYSLKFQFIRLEFMYNSLIIKNDLVFRLPEVDMF